MKPRNVSPVTTVRGNNTLLDQESVDLGGGLSLCEEYKSLTVTLFCTLEIIKGKKKNQ